MPEKLGEGLRLRLPEEKPVVEGAEDESQGVGISLDHKRLQEIADESARALDEIMNPPYPAKLLLAIPCNWDVVPIDFALSLMSLQHPIPFEALHVRMAHLDWMRTYLVSAALDRDFTHIFFSDADMVYPPDTLIKLMSETGYDMISGLACRRTPPHIPIYLQQSYKEESDGTKTPLRFVYDVGWEHVPPDGGVHEVDALGFSGTLVKTDVFRKIEKPWFRFDVQADDGRTVSEDIYFCTLAKEAGFKMAVHTGVVYGHLTSVATVPRVVDGKIGPYYVPLR